MLMLREWDCKFVCEKLLDIMKGILASDERDSHAFKLRRYILYDQKESY